MSDLSALLDDDTEAGPPRDRHKRPLIRPRDGGELVPHTRMSTLSGYVCDKSAITTWEENLLARGLAANEDLCALIASLPPLNGLKVSKDSLSREQKRQDKDTKAKLREYVDAAKDAAGRWYKARYGTAIHGFIEQADWTDAPERMKPDIASALAAFEEHGCEVIAHERFAVNEVLQAAGSFDYLIRHPRFGIVPGDCKTGTDAHQHGMEHAVQLAGYVNGELYDWDTETRTPLESLTGGEAINRDVGLLVHVPLGAGKTGLYPINLSFGLEVAKHAARTRDLRQYQHYLGPKLEPVKAVA